MSGMSVPNSVMHSWLTARDLAHIPKPMIYFAGDYAGHILHVPNLSGSRASGSPPSHEQVQSIWLSPISMSESRATGPPPPSRIVQVNEGQFLEWLKIMKLSGGTSSPSVNQGHVFYTGGCQPFFGNGNE